MDSDDSSAEDFAKHMAEHGFSGVEQVLGLENGELVKRFNDLRMRDAEAEIEKTEAEAELIKAHTNKHVIGMAFVLLLIVLTLAVSAPVVAMAWKAGF